MTYKNRRPFLLIFTAFIAFLLLFLAQNVNAECYKWELPQLTSTHPEPRTDTEGVKKNETNETECCYVYKIGHGYNMTRLNEDWENSEVDKQDMTRKENLVDKFVKWKDLVNKDQGNKKPVGGQCKNLPDDLVRYEGEFNFTCPTPIHPTYTYNCEHTNLTLNDKQKTKVKITFCCCNEHGCNADEPKWSTATAAPEVQECMPKHLTISVGAVLIWLLLGYPCLRIWFKLLFKGRGFKETKEYKKELRKKKREAEERKEKEKEEKAKAKAAKAAEKGPKPLMGAAAASAGAKKPDDKNPTTKPSTDAAKKSEEEKKNEADKDKKDDQPSKNEPPSEAPSVQVSEAASENTDRTDR